MIYDFKPYPAYKDSGVPWLGEVPEHWDVLPNRALFAEIKERENPDEQMLSVTITQGVIRQGTLLEGSSKKDSSNQDKSAYKLVCPRDIAYNKMRAWQGAVGVSDLRGIVSPAYVVVRLREDNDARYFHHLFRTPQFAKEAERWSYGITSDMWSLRPEHFKMIYCSLPSRGEQSAIVRFLDHADRRIRRFIHAKRKLIALLNEQKQTIILRAVTRGLDPNVRLKPSGMEWLGDVPEHWEVKRLRNLVTGVTSGSRGWSNYAADRGPLFIRIGNLTRGSIDLDLSDVARLNLPASVLGETARTRVAPDDILLSITAFIGSVAVVPSDVGEAYVSQHVACCRLAPGTVNARWVAYVLLSPIGKTYGALCMYGGTKQGLSLDDVKNHVVLLPPRDEQDELVQRIESEALTTEVTIRAAQREIDLLREYRSRLIADVVTGKLDVREAAARLPDETEEPEPLDEADAMTDADEDTADDLDEASEAVEA